MEIQEVNSKWARLLQSHVHPSWEFSSSSQFLVSIHTKSPRRHLVRFRLCTVILYCNLTKPWGQNPCLELYLTGPCFYYMAVRVKGAVGKVLGGCGEHLHRICDELIPGLVTAERTPPFLDWAFKNSDGHRINFTPNFSSFIILKSHMTPSCFPLLWKSVTAFLLCLPGHYFIYDPWHFILKWKFISQILIYILVSFQSPWVFTLLQAGGLYTT